MITTLQTLGPWMAPQPREIRVDEIELLTPREVAELFKVDQKTIVRWFNAGRLPGIKTPGGHARFHRHVVMARLSGGQDDPDES